MSVPPRLRPSQSGGPSSSQERRRANRRIFRRSLGVSLLLHVAALVLYPVLVGPPRGFLPRTPGSSPPLPEGLQLLALRELPPGVEQEAPPPDPLEERREEEQLLPVPPRMVPPGAQPAAPGEPAGAPGAELPAEAEAPRRSAAELLRPGAWDPELFGPLDLPELSEEERYRLQLAGRLEHWQDSVRQEMERQRRALDWTHTDDEGNRWGVSPGQIHLGKITLPLPFNFGTPPGRRDEIERRAWETQEINRGSVQGQILETQRDRAREIRARREAERADTLPPPRL